MKKLLADPARAVEFLGAVVNDGVQARIDAARALGPIVLDTQAITHPQFPEARIRTPLIVRLDAPKPTSTSRNGSGPIAFVIATRDTTRASPSRGMQCWRKGALTLSVYSRATA